MAKKQIGWRVVLILMAIPLTFFFLGQKGMFGAVIGILFSYPMMFRD